MQRLGEFTPYLLPTLRYGMTSNPLPSHGRGEESAQQRCLRASRQSALPLLLEKRRGEGEEFIAI
jgi:hypothetical protein